MDGMGCWLGSVDAGFSGALTSVMTQPMWRRPGVVRAVVVVMVAVLATVLGLVGVPGLLRLVLLGALAAGVGVRLGRDRWLVAGGVFFAVFGVAYVVLRDSIAGFLVAAVAFGAVWWWLTAAQPVVRRLAVGLVGPVVLAVGALPVSLVVNNLTLPRADVDRTVAEITGSLITEHVMQPDRIEQISYFGSQEGHIFTDSSGVPRSFKHYLVHVSDCSDSAVGGRQCDIGARREPLTELLAPFDGTIWWVEVGQKDGRDDHTLMLTPAAYPNVELVLHHVTVLAPRVADFRDSGVRIEPNHLLGLFGAPYAGRSLDVRAGEPLGRYLGDISVNVAAIGAPYFLVSTEGCDGRDPLSLLVRFNPACTRETRLVSYFSVLTPALAEDWRTWGISDLSDIIYTEDEYSRDLFQVRGFGPRGIYFGNVDVQTREQVVTDLTSGRLVRKGEPFVLAEGERLLVALLEPGDIFVTAPDGRGVMGGSFRLGACDAGCGGESPPGRLLEGLPSGVALLIDGEARWAAGIVAPEHVRGVERRLSPYVLRPTER